MYVRLLFILLINILSTFFHKDLRQLTIHRFEEIMVKEYISSSSPEK